MKKTGIRLLLSLILVTTVLVTATVPVSAAKPVKLGITITDISEGSITVNYSWNKIGAHYYGIFVQNSTLDTLDWTGWVNLGGRTPSKSGNVTLISPQITCGQTYRAYIMLLNRRITMIHGAIAYAHQPFGCPSLPFEEDFTGVAQYSLPAGWVTNNDTLVYCWNSAEANGTAPELFFDYGPSPGTIYDYWARTPAIDATGTTTSLNITFKHDLLIYDTWIASENFTYSVEVSIDAGSNWTAVLEETPTPTQYPTWEIGPETVNIDLSAYVGEDILVRWRLRGYTYNSNGWAIDDVIVDGY